MFKKISLAAALLASCAASNAAIYHFEGNIANHNDVVTTTFTLNSPATDVRVWTDSFMSGTNFDPITALWNASTGQKISENDDNPYIHAGQTYYDSGFHLASLDAGTYFFTVATYRNFALGTNISDGFAYSSQTPVSMDTWCQPASHCGMGTHWSVWLDGVSSASNPSDPHDIPEPASLALLGLGLAGVARSLSKKRSV